MVSQSRGDEQAGMGVDVRSFGVTAHGEEVHAIALRRAPLAVTIITLGARIQALCCPDGSGHIADVVLGHDTVAGYEQDRHYFGATIGRVANRIRCGRFILDGREHRVLPNDGPHALHGGPAGFDRANWRIAAVGTRDDASVNLAHVSPAGDQGFPGTLSVEARFALEEPGTLSVTYTATSDALTLVDLTSHTYWNLAGHASGESGLGHAMTIPADCILTVTDDGIPTGEFRPVAGTPFDFRVPHRLARRARDGREAQIVARRGFDHCFVFPDAAAGTPRRVAHLRHPASGRTLEVLSDRPGLQVYSGNFLDGAVAGKDGVLYRMGDGIALEPQHLPDTATCPEFGSIRLAPGGVFRHAIRYRLGVAPIGPGGQE
ncbi:galactose mutarotase [Erythrobacteraceae bacterium CFH 75059]|uniref:aldose epimerase family protein n=1 Tax=Qipengyuania thermophila TaxID=2509361 RepID=UPI00102110D8|nr:aldose epimerase family protein [Qipengyuania thermophila]TCD01893.1 galactose mutarotase [Erythrobacteraceae bacterium CFH 75059]